MSVIQDEFRMIISHALLGCDTDDVSMETWNLVMNECEKYALKLCKEQRKICAEIIEKTPLQRKSAIDVELEYRILNAPEPLLELTNQ